MDFYFRHIKSDVRITDSKGGASPQSILRDALALFREQLEHDERVRRERRVTSSAWSERRDRG